MPLAQLFQALPLTCPNSVTDTRNVAFINEATLVQCILTHIGEPTAPPRITPGRGPPPWEEEDSGTIFLDEERFTGNPLSQPQPQYELDQRVNW